MERTSRRMDGFSSFIVMDILEAALELEARGHDVVHLEIGEPDFQPPEPVVEAMARAVRDGKTHYTHSLGIPELREAIAATYHEDFGLDVSPERVCVTSGTSAAFLMVFAALAESGDTVVVTDPGYPCYPNFARLVSAAVRAVPVSEEEGFELTPELLARHDVSRAALVVVSSPANPTGAVTRRGTYEWLAGCGAPVLSDEIYRGLTYGGVQDFTALQVDDRTIVVDGFSKRYAMTGCRLGWVVVPPGMVRSMNRLAQNLYICPPSPSQWGGLAALAHGKPFVAAMRAQYDLRRRALLDGLRGLGFGVSHEPAGAFYVFADISRFSGDSHAFCLKMLHEAHVAATPGTDFGKFRTNRYVRFAYTSSLERITEALGRLAIWTASLPRT